MRQMVAKSPYDAYRRVQAETSSGADLVLLLLRGALRFLDRAQSGVEDDDIQLAHNSLTRAQDIISELNTTLDHEQGGDLAGGLESIYTYALERLIEANMRKRVEPIQEVRRLIAELTSAWEESLAASRTGPVITEDG